MVRLRYKNIIHFAGHKKREDVLTGILSNNICRYVSKIRSAHN